MEVCQPTLDELKRNWKTKQEWHPFIIQLRKFSINPNKLLKHNIGLNLLSLQTTGAIIILFDNGDFY